MDVELIGCTDNTRQSKYAFLVENSEDLSHRTLDLFWQRCPELQQYLADVPDYREDLLSALIGLFGFYESSEETTCNGHLLALAQRFLSLELTRIYFLLLGECMEQALTDVLFDEATEDLIEGCLDIHNQIYTLFLKNGM